MISGSLLHKSHILSSCLRGAEMKMVILSVGEVLFQASSSEPGLPSGCDSGRRVENSVQLTAGACRALKLLLLPEQLPCFVHAGA